MAATPDRESSPSQTDRKSRASGRARWGAGRRVGAALALACLAAGLGGCDNAVKNVVDYLNLRNSFLTPSEVGRFDKTNPWGNVRPVKWPILEQLDVIDAPANEWDAATDPTPADAVADNKESTLGAGDLLRLSIMDLQTPGQEWLKEAVVSETGTVDILFLGPVQVAGLTPSQANEKIGQIAIDKHALLPPGNGSPGPQVSISVVQSRSHIFSILGLVGRPGTYNIIGTDFRVLNALAMAGDLPMQPGLDYLYVIRPAQSETPPPVAAPSTGSTGVTPPATGNPLDALESIEKSTTAPAATAPGAPSPMPPASAPGAAAPIAPTAPAPMGPGTTGPTFLRPLPTAMVASGAGPAHGTLMQVDLDAAMNGTSGATTAPASAPAAAPATGPTGAGGGDDLLNQAVDSGNAKTGKSIYVDGKWVTLPPTPGGATGVPVAPVPGTVDTGIGTVTPTNPIMPAKDAFAVAERLSGQRVIRIPIAALRSGDPRYNIIIRPGDTIMVPPVETGEFYIMGHVTRPGVFSLSGRKITLKMAIAASGNLDAVAIPRRCDLVRRIGTNQEATVMVNLQAIFDGTQPDIFLKPNDLINVGTDAVAPFLAITRNAYRLSYGFGFVYDRNFFIQPQGKVQQ